MKLKAIIQSMKVDVEPKSDKTESVREKYPDYEPPSAAGGSTKGTTIILPRTKRSDKRK